MQQATQVDVHVGDRAPTARGRSTAGDLSSRAAGWGALTFAIVVIAQNVIRGASAPGNDASAAKVLSHYSGDEATSILLAATYVLSGIGLAVFIGGITRRLLATSRSGWAITGLVGAIGIFTVFALVVAAEQALTVAAHMDRPDLGAMQALWALHNSIFSVLDLSIALALLGLSRAAVAAGLNPKAFNRLAPRRCQPPAHRHHRWTAHRRRPSHGAVRSGRRGLRHLARIPGRDRSPLGSSRRARLRRTRYRTTRARRPPRRARVVMPAAPQWAGSATEYSSGLPRSRHRSGRSCRPWRRVDLGARGRCSG